MKDNKMMSPVDFVQVFNQYRDDNDPQILLWTPEEKVLQLKKIAQYHLNPMANWAILKSKGDVKVSYEVWMKDVSMEFGELMTVIYKNYVALYNKNQDSQT